MGVETFASGASVAGESTVVPDQEVVVMAARAVQWFAFGVMALFGLVGTAFVVGEAMTDPGGWQGAALSAAWVVPMLVVAWIAWARPATGVHVVRVAVVLVVLAWLWAAVDPDLWRDTMEQLGPVLPVATLAVGVPTAVLGLHRPRTAGMLLLVVGLVPLVSLLVVVNLLDAGAPPAGGGILRTSGGIGAVPTLLSGLLFLVAGQLAGTQPAATQQRPPDGSAQLGEANPERPVRS